MSNFSDMAAGLKTVLQNGITGLRAFDYPPDSIDQFPAAVIMPESLDPRIALTGNSFTAVYRVIFLFRKGDEGQGFTELYDFIDPTAANKSLIAAIRADPTLNAKADDAEITRIEKIGRRELWGGSYYGFDALIEVVKSVA